MARASYHILPFDEGWSIDHDGEMSGPYATREAAFEAVLGPASNAIKEGAEVTISVAASETPTSAERS